MQIRDRKLPKEAIQKLRRLPVGTFEPNTVLVAPVYVYLPKNEKFVAVKFPLQHFAKEDLDKLKAYENFYLPEFVDLVEPFRSAGEIIRSLLDVKQKRPIKTSLGEQLAVVPMPQHERDDAVLHLTGPLWSSGVKVEPFFLCFFANEVCLPFSPEKLTAAVDTNVEAFELALLRASSAVFLALHIGYADTRTLSALRDKVFSDSMQGVLEVDTSREVALLEHLIWALIPDSNSKGFSPEIIEAGFKESGLGGRVAKKILSRLERVRTEFVVDGADVVSIFGEKGVCDG